MTSEEDSWARAGGGRGGRKGKNVDQGGEKLGGRIRIAGRKDGGRKRERKKKKERMENKTEHNRRLGRTGRKW